MRSPFGSARRPAVIEEAGRVAGLEIGGPIGPGQICCEYDDPRITVGQVGELLAEDERGDRSCVVAVGRALIAQAAVARSVEEVGLVLIDGRPGHARASEGPNPAVSSAMTSS